MCHIPGKSLSNRAFYLLSIKELLSVWMLSKFRVLIMSFWERRDVPPKTHRNLMFTNPWSHKVGLKFYWTFIFARQFFRESSPVKPLSNSTASICHLKSHQLEDDPFEKPIQQHLVAWMNSKKPFQNSTKQMRVTWWCNLHQRLLKHFY